MWTGVGKIHSFADCPFFPTGFTTENGGMVVKKTAWTPGFSNSRKGFRRPGLPPSAILPISQAPTDLPVIIGHPGPYSAQNRAKTGNGYLPARFVKNGQATRVDGDLYGMWNYQNFATLRIRDAGALALFGRSGRKCAGFSTQRHPPRIHHAKSCR